MATTGLPGSSRTSTEPCALPIRLRRIRPSPTSGGASSKGSTRSPMPTWMLDSLTSEDLWTPWLHAILEADEARSPAASQLERDQRDIDLGFHFGGRLAAAWIN